MCLSSSLTFQGNVVVPSSGSKSKLSKHQTDFLLVVHGLLFNAEGGAHTVLCNVSEVQPNYELSWPGL